MEFKLNGSKEGKKEWNSPNKLPLLVLVRELSMSCSIDDEQDKACILRCRHNLALLLIQLLQGPDMEINDLRHKLKRIDQELPRLLVSRLHAVMMDGLSSVVDFFQCLEELFSAKEPALHKSSLFGLFVRRMSLLFQKMTFSQVAHYYTLLEDFIKTIKTDDDDDDDDLDESMDTSQHVSEKEPGQKGSSDFLTKMSSSSRQVEFFLANQASSIERNGGVTLQPLELQTRISNLLATSPDITEAHYVSYLNCLRVGEYKQALDSLYHYFDQQQWITASKASPDSTETTDEKCRSFRYAALNLATLHCRLGHRSEALAALKEAIEMAQETNDHVCLEHCLLWLYRLEKEGSTQASLLLDRFVARAAELKLPYLSSLSMLTHTRHDALIGMPPPKVLQALSHISTINSQNSLQDLTATTDAQHASAWECYGKNHVSSVFSQLLLNRSTNQQPLLECNSRDTDNSQSDVQNGEAMCLSLCNLAKVHANKGMFTEAAEIMEFCKKTFPQPSNLSKIWMLSEAIILHEKALHQGDMNEAERAVDQMSALDNMQAKYRSAVNMTHKGNFSEARKVLSQVLEQCKKTKTLSDGQKSGAELQSNILLALSQLYFMSGNPLSALSHLLDCLTLSCGHYLDHCAALASLMIGHLQLSLGLPGKALVLVKSSMVHILSHASLYIQCCAQFLLVRCQLAANSAEDSREKRKSTLLSSLPTLDHVLEGFSKLMARQKIFDVLYYQARIYDELGYTAERNNCSTRYCQLLEQKLVKHTAGSSLCCI